MLLDLQRRNLKLKLVSINYLTKLECFGRTSAPMTKDGVTRRCPEALEINLFTINVLVFVHRLTSWC